MRTIFLGIKDVCNIIYYDSTVIAAKTLMFAISAKVLRE